MATTFEELKAIAEGTDLKFFCDQEKQILLFSGLGRGGIYNLIMRLMEEGEAIYFRVPYLAVVPSDHPKLSEVMLRLMKENDRIKIGRFCYDPDDGEVYLDWFIPLEDGALTIHQLKRCIKTLMVLADEVGMCLRHLLETGEDLPEEKKLEGMLRLLNGGLSEEDEVRLRRLFQGFKTSTEEEDEP